jgi:hypothetical protein
MVRKEKRSKRIPTPPAEAAVSAEPLALAVFGYCSRFDQPVHQPSTERRSPKPISCSARKNVRGPGAQQVALQRSILTGHHKRLFSSRSTHSSTFLSFGIIKETVVKKKVFEYG